MMKEVEMVRKRLGCWLNRCFVGSSKAASRLCSGSKEQTGTEGGTEGGREGRREGGKEGWVSGCDRWSRGTDRYVVGSQLSIVM